MSGLEAVMSRISEIESRFGGAGSTTSERVLGTVGSTGTATSSTATRSTSALFAGALSSATGSAAPTTTSPAPTRTALTSPITTTVPRPTPTGTGQSAATQPALTRPVVTPQVVTQPAATSPSATAGLGQAAVAKARTYLGIPYRWGGTDPAKGLDCSGLVQLVYGQLGVKLPRTAATQARAGTAVPDLAHARPGDLVVFRGGHHIGIYLGDGRMIHAPKTGDVVKISGMRGHGEIFAIRRIESTPSQNIAVATGPTSSSSGAAVLDRLASIFGAAESRYGLPAGLLRAVASVESGGRVDAVSRAGAQGLMQLMPATARGLGVNPLDPAQAIDGAARLLRSHLKTFGDLDLALAAYNAGPGAVRRHHGIPPYTETQNYVRKIHAALAGGN